MKTLKYISIALISLLLFASCNNQEMSVQEYYVTSEKNNNYLMIDVPIDIVSLSDNASQEAKDAYNSIDKVNLLAFKLDDSNKADYLIEKEKLKKVLKNPNYKDLMRTKIRGVKFVAKYMGNENAMDEVLVYASDKDKGFALARVTGDNMKPENMFKLLESIKSMDKDNGAFQQMESFFGKH